MLGIGLGLWPTARNTGGIPQSVSSAPIWLDPSDLATLKQERAGAGATTAAAINGNVGSARNKGALGGWFVAASDARRPTLRSDGTLYWLEFDGVDDYLSLPAPALNLVTVEVYLGARILGWTTNQNGLVTLAPASGGDFNSNTGMFIGVNGNDNSVVWRGGATGGLIINAAGSMPAPHVFELRKPNNSSAELVIDRATAGTDSSMADVFTTQGGDLLLGARYVNGNAQFGNVAIYGLAITNQVTTDLTAIRTYFEAKTTGQQPLFPALETLGDAEDARDVLINELFSGPLPNDLATLEIESPHPLNGVVTLANLNFCEKLTIPGFSAVPRLWTPNSPRNDKIVLLVAGHSVTLSGNGLGSVALQTLLNANIRVCTFVLPGGPDDLTSGGPADHEEDLDSLAEWAGPPVIAINTLLDDFPTASFYIAGISGGCITTVLAAACDTRIAGSYQFVGSFPDYFYLNRDHEQRLPGITADFMTLYLLGACPGRRHKHILYESDPVGFNRALYNTRDDWSVDLAAQATALTGDYDLVWVNYNQHAFVNPSFTNEVLNEITA